MHLPHNTAPVHSKESRGSSNSSSDGAGSLEGLHGKAALRGVVPAVLAANHTDNHTPVQVGRRQPPNSSR